MSQPTYSAKSVDRLADLRFPELVIAGAPKSGTTSFYDWLTTHPRVGGAGKDTYFLADRGVELGHSATRRLHEFGLAEYAAQCPPDADLVVEAGASYLYQETARAILSSLPKPPRIVAILRDPAERLYSVYGYFSNNHTALAANLSFAEYVDALRDGRPVGTTDPTAADALRHGEYVDFLLKWREVFGPEKILIMRFDAVVGDPRSALERAVGGFGIDPAFWDMYEYGNALPTRAVRNRTVNRAVRRLARKVPRSSLPRVKALYWRLNASRSTERPREDVAVMAELREHYHPYNLRLTEEFGLSTGSWSAGGQ